MSCPLIHIHSVQLCFYHCFCVLRAGCDLINAFNPFFGHALFKLPILFKFIASLFTTETRECFGQMTTYARFKYSPSSTNFSWYLQCVSINTPKLWNQLEMLFNTKPFLSLKSNLNWYLVCAFQCIEFSFYQEQRTQFHVNSLECELEEIDKVNKLQTVHTNSAQSTPTFASNIILHLNEFSRHSCRCHLSFCAIAKLRRNNYFIKKVEFVREFVQPRCGFIQLNPFTEWFVRICTHRVCCYLFRALERMCCDSYSEKWCRN